MAIVEIVFLSLLVLGIIALMIWGCLDIYRCKHQYEKVEYMDRWGSTRYVLVCQKCGKIKYLRD